MHPELHSNNNRVIIQKNLVWCIKRWVRVRYEGGVILIGGTEDSSSTGTISNSSTDCNLDEFQGWYYFSTVQSQSHEYRSISLSVIVAGGRLCQSMLGCSCTMHLFIIATFNSVCTQCDYSICEDHEAQAPILLITALLLNPPTLEPLRSPTLEPIRSPTLEPILSPTPAET